MAGTRNPNSTISYTIADYDGEKSTMQFSSVEYNILTFADFLTAVGDFRDSVGGISGGAIQREILTTFNRKFDPLLPTDQNMQRERKWLIRYKDNVTFGVYTLEVPCAKVIGAGALSLLQPASNKADLTRAEWIAFIADFAQVARSEDGNPVTFLDAVLVGRNI